MTDLTHTKLHSYLRQTGGKGGALEIVTPTIEKGLRAILKSKKSAFCKEGR